MADKLNTLHDEYATANHLGPDSQTLS